MTQTITTDLPALTPTPAVVLFSCDTCATCGGDVVQDADNPTVAFCGKCYAVDLAPVGATLAALAWAKAAGHHVDDISASEWTHEDDRDRPPLAIPGRYWYVTLGVVQGDQSAPCPLYVVQHADGGMQVVPDTFPTCQYQGLPECERYLVTGTDGVRACPEHGPVTAWNIPLSFYEDEPETLTEDTAAFAATGTVQWLDDDE